MGSRGRSRLLLVAFCAAGASSGCGIGVVPGLLPTWAADTLGSADLELPSPVVPARSTERTAGTAPTPSRPAESVIALVAEPRRFGAEEEASVWVEMELKDRGLRFGTDGTVATLFEFVRSRHGLVAPAQTRSGDVLFFDVSGRSRCGDHAGVVDEVDAAGRITFRESRGGLVRLSYAHPGQPSRRRALDGRVINTFLRIRRADDPAGSRYLAGDLLCAVGRVATRVERPLARRGRPGR
jgi:hypothetical protein